MEESTTTETAAELRGRLIPLSPDDPRVSDALFGVREAALLIDVPVATLHGWARGRVAGGNPLIEAFDSEGRGTSIPFLGLVEAYVLSAFRKEGVSMQRLRPALEKLKADLGLEYALASGHLYTDGLEVLFDYAASADPPVGGLTEVRSGQTVIRRVVRDYLRHIEWDSADWAKQLTLPRFQRAAVVVDVERAFGRPLLVHGGARVEDLRDRWLGGDSIRAIARDFGVPVDECEDAIRVACQLPAAA